MDCRAPLQGSCIQSTLNATWEKLEGSHPHLLSLLSQGARTGAAKKRYEDLLEQRGAVLACFFNLCTAMAGIQFPVGTPLDYMKEVVWADLAEDRLFVYADKAVIG